MWEEIKNKEITELLEKLKVAQDQRASGQKGKKHSTVFKSLRKRIAIMKKKS